MSARTGRLLTVATSVLLVVAIGLLAYWLVLGRTVRADRALETARVEALAAAKQAAVNANSYDYSKLDAQFSRVERELTGSALADFTKSKDQLRQGFTAAKETAVAQVLQAATISAQRDEATELLALTITFRSPQGQAVPTLKYAQLHLVKNQGRWLVDTFASVT